jgi:hypothetical protein
VGLTRPSNKGTQTRCDPRPLMIDVLNDAETALAELSC